MDTNAPCSQATIRDTYLMPFEFDCIGLLHCHRTKPKTKYRYIGPGHFPNSYGDTREIVLLFFYCLSLQVPLESGLHCFSIKKELFYLTN